MSGMPRRSLLVKTQKQTPDSVPPRCATLMLVASVTEETEGEGEGWVGGQRARGREMGVVDDMCEGVQRL